ncbi:hypothetical protein E1293_07345 [Actinomadura darangshiensis]|uniref:Alpha-L-rhamnosidase n=1 Tax=Actinomadura darangshiensis TaxID=705336 RepID=A0A4V2YX69_9ACTN|nr:alpha-L-rhamnosidase C-terminal domain-containing protein [Actinomadura darangshiensis]TDD87817.1 hypothetical protein E1293_07345 [Actinomadura darangshiensis]
MIRKSVAAAIAVPAVLLGSVPAASAQPAGTQPADQVLAPASRTVKPRAVTLSDARGGSIDGRPDALLRRDGKAVRLTSTGGRATSPIITLDFGGDIAGKAALRVLSASQNRPGLHVCFSESRMHMALKPGQNGGETEHAPGCDTANVFNGYPGQPYTWDSDSHALPLDKARLPATVKDDELRGGFRYATVFLDGPGWVDLDAMTVGFTAAPNQRDLRAYRGSFRSADPELNKIWYAGAYTVQLDTDLPTRLKGNIAADPAAVCWPNTPGEPDTSHNTLAVADPNIPVMLDGGKRDRDPFTGDLAVQGPVAYLSTGDTATLRNTLDAFAKQQVADGFVPGNGQICPESNGHVLGDYNVWFVHDVYLHWLYTADPKALGDWWTAVTGATDWAAKQIDDSGLVSYAAYGDDGGCGTYGYNNCEHLTFFNAGLYQALREVAQMARAKGQDDLAASYESKAGGLAKAIQAKLWDEEAGAYRQSTEKPDVYPQDANAFAVSAGIAAPAQARRAMAYLKTRNWGPYGSLTVPEGTTGAAIDPRYEPLPQGVEADARFGVDDASGLELIRRGWGYQLKRDPGNTFWEKANPDGTPGIGSFTSLAHGWASQPTVTLTNRVLGVTPTGAGYTRFDVRPHPSGLPWAQGTVPTPHGDIVASWRRTGHGFQLKVTAPRGTHGRLAVPVDSSTRRVTLDGRTVWAAGKPTARGVSTDGSFVYVDGASAGRHTLTAH